MNNIELKELNKYVRVNAGISGSKLREIKNRIKRNKPFMEKMTASNALNLKKDIKDERDFLLTETRPTELPSRINWQPTMSSVKDQGRLGCHDDKTEILTNEGWKYFKDLNKKELVATVNPNTHKLEYQKPLNYFEYDYKGKMYNLIHNNKTIFSVTPNHKMYVRKWNQKNKKISDYYSFVEAKDLGWYSGLLIEIKVNSRIEKNEKKYKLPDVNIGLRKGAKKESIRKGKEVLLSSLVEFMGLYFAEGCCYNDKRGSYRVEIAASDNNPRKQKVIEVVENLGFNYSYYHDRLTICNKSLYKFLKPFGDVYTKRVPRWIFNLDKEHIELFLNGYIMGDGRKEENGGIFCWSVNKELLSDIQELFLLVGRWSTIGISSEERDVYIKDHVAHAKRNFYLYSWYGKLMSIDRKKYLKEVDYNGKVYCVEVPNHILITRRKGKMLVSGNSCVGFATAAMKEWQEQQEHEREVAEGKSYRREQDHYDLSEAWIYWNCKKIDPWPNSEGTSIRCAMQVLNKIGVPCEKAYPYSDTYKGEPESWAKMISRWGLIGSYYRVRNLTELKTALVNGPVVIGIACFREIFFVGSDGIIPYPNNPNEIFGGHAIAACGYNDNSGYVRFKNSWGKHWGRKGYGFLPYKYIDDFMIDAWFAKDLNVTRKMFNDSMDNTLT